MPVCSGQGNKRPKETNSMFGAYGGYSQNAEEKVFNWYWIVLDNHHHQSQVTLNSD